MPKKRPTRPPSQTPPPPPPPGGTDPPPPPTPPPTPGDDLPGWTQIFYDDFSTPCAEGAFLATYGAKWGAYPLGWQDTAHHGIYDPRILSVADSILSYRIHTSADGVHRVANPFPLLPGPRSPHFGIEVTPRLYGRYALRFRADSLHGYKMVPLLWPYDALHEGGQWPLNGEIDFPEGDLDTTIDAFMHHQNGVDGADQDGYHSPKTFADWHVAVTEWTAGHCKFYLDDVLLGHSTVRVPNTTMRWTLQVETSLAPAPPPASSVTGRVQLDWVAVWAPV